MGNLSTTLFGTSAEKEWKKLTKKNTKANREVPGEGDPGLAGAAPPAASSVKRPSSGNNRIAFVNLVTEVTYDHDVPGEVEVAHEVCCPPANSPAR
eukprot:1449170-Rhodomonas_salina.4